MDINVGDVLKLKKQRRNRIIASLLGIAILVWGMGSTPRGSGLSTEMSGLRSPDYDRTEITRKKCERNR
jgi:hypothetical protein